MGVNPDNNWAARFEIIPEKEKVIKQLKKASKDVETIFLATDLDREGEISLHGILERYWGKINLNTRESDLMKLQEHLF